MIECYAIPDHGGGTIMNGVYTRIRHAAAFAMAILCGLAGPSGAAGPTTTTPAPAAALPYNFYNEELLKLTPDERAAKLAAYLGFWCIGSKPFLMGVTRNGPSVGYAYWSLECVGSKSYAIQIAPDGKGDAIECEALKTSGQGRECFKTF
jgi:hypothetical protein